MKLHHIGTTISVEMWAVEGRGVLIRVVRTPEHARWVAERLRFYDGGETEVRQVEQCPSCAGAGCSVCEWNDEATLPFDVMLTQAGSQRVRVMQVVRGIYDLGLAETQAQLDATPFLVGKSLTKPQAESLKAQLKAAGAEAELRPSFPR